ncbi:methyltransferase domain-containing protein [Brevibacillus choshinensis]|uniref:methyltransferase domain-containing protein n=1 Tax=Brevibacillus choshinensis TaxID=54911 RepID=UPI00137B2D43
MCGNKNFREGWAELGKHVIAFDYSPKMIELSKLRSKDYLDRIDFKVIDATK